MKMINVLLVLNIIVVILLIGIILLQKSEGGVLGMGGGSKNGIFTAQSAGNLITKITYFLGAMFFIICIALAFLVARKNNASKSFIETMAEKNNVKEVKSTDVKLIPENKVKEEMAKESIKEEVKAKKKPVAPVSK